MWLSFVKTEKFTEFVLVQERIKSSRYRIPDESNALQEKDYALRSALKEKTDALKKSESVQQENERLKAEIAKLLQR